MLKSPTIVRSLSAERFDAFLKDFAFLFERVRLERGELDLRLRHDYFNLYHRGNSLARVDVSSRRYPISIHKVFAEGIYSAERFGVPRPQGDYLIFDVAGDLLKAFLSKQHIARLSSTIADRNFSQEITFEQMIITDNMNRDDFYIMDRQVCGGPLGRKKLDLLAIEQVSPGSRQYRLIVLEAKLGNNPELCGKVGRQLDDYVRLMNAGFDEFKKCYEATYAQMRKTGVFTSPSHETIEIVPPVTGWVTVGGYSGIAHGAIQQLLRAWPQTQVRRMFHIWQR